MKRGVPSATDNGAVLPLKKRVSSLFSISTIYDEDDDEDNDCTSRSNAYYENSSHDFASNNSSSIGLDLMANNSNTIKDEHQSESVLPEVFIKSPNRSSLPSVTPSSLSCAEESSCTTDDDDDESAEMSSLSSSGGVVKHPLSSATTIKIHAPHQTLLSKEKVAQEVAQQVLCSDNKGWSNDQGDFRTGLVFEAGSDHYDRHSRLHKERPLRVTSIMDALKKSNNDVFDRCCVLGEEEEEASSNATVTPLATTAAATIAMPTKAASQFLDDEDYLRVHLPGYMKRLDKLCNCCDEERLDQEAEQFKSIYFTKDSLKEAKKAASSLSSLVEHVVQGHLDNGFAVIRPPGHHAEPGLAGGYCIINNIAVAAAYARAKLGVEKILIVDWDVHHGNGTQAMFVKDPNVLYFSAHRWHGGNFFPFLSNGGPTSVGMGDGEGFNMNVGWTAKGMGDDEYLAVWERLLMPVAKEFRPDLILVSAGFDAADGDLGECRITPEGYGRLTRSLMTLDTPIVCALEGGYVRSILGKCVTSVVTALLERNSAKEGKLEDDEDCRERGDDVDVLDTISATAAKNIKATISAHKSHWKCLCS